MLNEILLSIHQRSILRLFEYFLTTQTTILHLFKQLQKKQLKHDVPVWNDLQPLEKLMLDILPSQLRQIGNLPGIYLEERALHPSIRHIREIQEFCKFP